MKKQDPKKKAADSTFSRGQQLSDKYINLVSKKKMTYAEATKKQAAEDKKVPKTVLKRDSTTGKGKSVKAKYTLDKKGNKKAY